MRPRFFRAVVLSFRLMVVVERAAASLVTSASRSSLVVRPR